ncbi:MAG TPA: amino acid adenylation domain-containing protein, partial [Blastocatellia bacterium]|nr:amino acid adenylation domain-containing protein [Blastocatellia bacterium]
GEPQVRQLLSRVKETALGAYANQEVPFEKLVEDLQPERDVSRTPLFQVMFVQQPPMPEWKVTGIRVKPWVLEGQTSKFEMTLSIIEQSNGRLQGWLEYNTNLFDARMMERLIGHYELLLREMAARPTERISRLSLLTNSEREKLIFGWNNTRAHYNVEACMDELFEIQASVTPDSTAVVFEDQHLSYCQLDIDASLFAAHLTSSGVEPGDLVGISMERSLEIVIALIAVLKAGAAYLPLDPNYPKDRLVFMLEDSAVRLLLTQVRLSKALPTNGLKVLCLDEGGEHSSTKSVKSFRRTGGRRSTDSLAYAIYTSGSTGKPKAVMTSHRGMCNLVLWMQYAFPLGPKDRMIQRTAFSFDASIWEFFWPLIAGATLVVASPEATVDAKILVNTLVEKQVTVLQAVQSLFQVVLEVREMQDCRSLRHVFCGGEALSPAVRDRLYNSGLEAELHNVYGPTEASMHVTNYNCPRDERERVIPVGGPIGNSRLYVLDPNLEPSPIWVPGLLHIGGACLAHGYRSRPDLTADRFVPDPHAESPGERIYRTGDLAKFREDGNIEFLGRADHQVKIRGYRIELGEIEAHLAQHPAVFQAVAIVREDTPGSKRLVAYVVLNTREAVSGNDLRNFLLTKLPEYMVPSFTVLLDQIPLMSNGKLDRTALPAPDMAGPGQGEPFVAPRNEIESELASIFREVISVDGIGVNDNFFNLGGHSLSATQVMIRIRDVFHVDISLRRLFETPTIAGLAVAIKESEPLEVDDEPIEIISNTAVDEPSPLSSMLEGLSREDLESLLAVIAARKKI